MKKITFFLFLGIIKISIVFSQPAIQWQKSLGGSANEVAFSIKQTNDSVYIVAGYSNSNDSDVSGHRGASDFWIVKLNNGGSILWQKSLGGTDVDIPNSIEQTIDGGYIVSGYSLSNDIDVTVNKGVEDFWIVKLDNQGVIQWQKSFGGSNIDEAYSIQQTIDSGYIVAGASKSDDGDVTSHHVAIAIQNDFWIVKLNSLGILQWEKSLGGTSSDFAKSIIQTSDGGFIVAGNTNSNDGDVTGLHGTPSYADIWIVKLNSSGSIQWQKTFGGTNLDVANCIQQTSDGGYIVAGASNSDDGDLTLHWGSLVDSDVWIFKLDSSGSIVWQKTFGGTSIDAANYVQQTSDGGYVIAGYTNSNDGDLTGLHGLAIDYDYWIIKLDSSGVMHWQNTYGGTNNDIANSIRQTNDNNFIIAGSSRSINGDVTGNNGSSDYWIVKLDAYVGINEINVSQNNIKVSPNPFSDETVISFNLLNSGVIFIEIRDAQGRTIKNLKYKNVNNSGGQFVWDATDNTGFKVCNGLYFVTMISNAVCESSKVVVLRR